MHDFNSVSGMWSEIQLKGSVGQRGGEGTNVEGIKRKGGEEGGSRGLWGERRGGGRWGGAEGGGGCIPPLSPLSEGFWTGRGPAEREGKRWRVEERRGMEGKGRGRCGFCLLPTFQSQSWKMNRQRKINCMTFTERKREIERAGEGGKEGGERQIMEGRS